MSYWFEREHKLPQGRLTFTSYVFVTMIALLVLGFWNLQVVQSDYFHDLAERNRVRAIPIIAPRGPMLDREGRVLVDTYPSHSVLLLRDDPKEVQEALPRIAEGLGVTVEDLNEQLEAAKSLPRFHPLLIKPEASPSDIAFIEAHRADLPMLELLMVHRRRYPQNGFLAHASGYVGEASAAEIERGEGRLRSGDIVGKTGLERQYNDTLMGTDGFRRAIVNSIGKEVGKLDQVEAIPGKPLQLTIDYDLQVIAEAALAGRKGAVVAMDPRTGEILALASQPAPDPNFFAVRVPREEWKRLNEDPGRPLLNRVVQAQLAPGSTFKIVMATAILETGAVPENLTVFCPGYGTFYGRQFKCHMYGKGGHGLVDFHKAIVQSCNIFFYEAGKRLGIDRIAQYAMRLGLGQKTGIDIPGEEQGLMPSEEWKQRVYKQPWYAGETISIAVGQGATMITPLQLARTVGGIASGGTFIQPHLVRQSVQAPEYRFPLREHTVELVTQGMFGVVNEGGTAAASRLEGIEFCGKTGSAQSISYEGLRRVGNKREFTENAWFVGFAPRRNPEIVVSVLLEQGAHGSLAAPVARDIIKAYYEKKGRRDNKQFTVDFKRHDLSAPLAATITVPQAPAQTGNQR